MQASDSQGVEVRRAGPRDVLALMTLRASWRETAVSKASSSEFLAWFEREGSHRWWWLAEDPAGGAIEMVNLKVFDKMPSPGCNAGRWGYLANLFVHPAYRGEVLGARLVRRCSRPITRKVSYASSSARAYSRYRFIGEQASCPRTCCSPGSRRRRTSRDSCPCAHATLITATRQCSLRRTVNGQARCVARQGKYSARGWRPWFRVGHDICSDRTLLLVCQSPPGWSAACSSRLWGGTVNGLGLSDMFILPTGLLVLFGVWYSKRPFRRAREEGRLTTEEKCCSQVGQRGAGHHNDATFSARRPEACRCPQ